MFGWMKRTARAATRALVGPLAEVGRALVSVTSSIREIFGIVKRERFPPREPPRGPEPPEPPPVGPEEPEEPEGPGWRDGPIGPELPPNLIIIRGRPRGELEGSFRGTFFFLEDVIEYASDVPIQVRAYALDGVYLVYISADSDAVVPLRRSFKHARRPRRRRTFGRGVRWRRGVV